MLPKRTTTSSSRWRAGPRARVRTVDVLRADDAGRPRDIQSRVPVKSGAFYDRAELRAASPPPPRHWRSKRYHEAQVKADPVPSDDGTAVDIVITFIRGPLVTVAVKDDALTPKQLAEFVPVEREGSVDEDLLEDAESRIEEYLRSQGYRDGDATFTRSCPTATSCGSSSR